MINLHRELELVLQIILSCGKAEPGWYEEVEYGKWQTSSKTLSEKTFEVRGRHTLDYHAVVKAENVEQAFEIADGRNLLDDKFWFDDPDSWRFEIYDINEIEDE